MLGFGKPFQIPPMTDALILTWRGPKLLEGGPPREHYPEARGAMDATVRCSKQPVLCQTTILSSQSHVAAGRLFLQRTEPLLRVQGALFEASETIAAQWVTSEEEVASWG